MGQSGSAALRASGDERSGVQALPAELPPPINAPVELPLISYSCPFQLVGLE